MAKLVITVETEPVGDGGPDPRLVDPHEVARVMVREYNEMCRVEGEHENVVTFQDAEWER